MTMEYWELALIESKENLISSLSNYWQGDFNSSFNNDWIEIENEILSDVQKVRLVILIYSAVAAFNEMIFVYPP